MFNPPPEELAWVPDDNGQEPRQPQSFEELEKHSEKEQAKALEEIAENMKYLEQTIKTLCEDKDADPIFFKKEIKKRQDRIDDIITATGVLILQFGTSNDKKDYRKLLESWEGLK